MNYEKCDVCGGSVDKIRPARGDRDLNTPPSRYIYQCVDDATHQFEDPHSMPVDRSRSI